MTGKELATAALRLHEQIVRQFKPTPEGFEELSFWADGPRVVVWDWETVEFRDMAVVELPSSPHRRVSSS